MASVLHVPFYSERERVRRWSKREREEKKDRETE
jgi:hypothetical protein